MQRYVCQAIQGVEQKQAQLHSRSTKKRIAKNQIANLNFNFFSFSAGYIYLVYAVLGTRDTTVAFDLN
jgi:hypothetical protein